MMFHQAHVGAQFHIQFLPHGPWFFVEKRDDTTAVELNSSGARETHAFQNVHPMLPIKTEDGTPQSRWYGLSEAKAKRKKVVTQTTRMFQVVIYEDGTADLCGFTFKDHPTMRIIGDGSLQNPLEIVPK